MRYILQIGFNDNGTDTALVFDVSARVPGYVTTSDVLSLVIDVYLDDKLALSSSTAIPPDATNLVSPVNPNVYIIIRCKIYIQAF